MKPLAQISPLQALLTPIQLPDMHSLDVQYLPLVARQPIMIQFQGQKYDRSFIVVYTFTSCLALVLSLVLRFETLAFDRSGETR